MTVVVLPRVVLAFGVYPVGTKMPASPCQPPFGRLHVSLRSPVG